jgi:hypothetical protein
VQQVDEGGLGDEGKTPTPIHEAAQDMGHHWPEPCLQNDRSRSSRSSCECFSLSARLCCSLLLAWQSTGLTFSGNCRVHDAVVGRHAKFGHHMLLVAASSCNTSPAPCLKRCSWQHKHSMIKAVCVSCGKRPCFKLFRHYHCATHGFVLLRPFMLQLYRINAAKQIDARAIPRLCEGSR